MRAYGRPTTPLDMRVDGQSFNITNDGTYIVLGVSQRGFPIQKDNIRAFPAPVRYLIDGICQRVEHADPNLGHKAAAC